MASVKKRKLDGAGSGSGSGSSTPTAMSAFAARQQLWGAAATRAAAVPNKGTPEPPEDATRSRKSGSETPSARSVPPRSTKRQAPEEPVLVEAKQTQATSIEGGSGPTTPRPELSGVTIRQHSSFKPNKKNLQKKAGGRLVLATPEAERLVILGSYGIKIREGEVTIAGAILTPSDGVQWVHAPLCHGIPVLRTADETVLELQPHPAAKGLRQLAKLNPAFARLWNENPEANSAKSKSSATFQIIYTSEDVPKRAILQELVSPAEWNKKLSGLAAAKRKGTPGIFLCGPKSSGKSTFGRLLANRFMTDRGGSKNNPWSSVMVLDIDPGQPEYSPPGVISLTRLTTPNLSPSFCHPTLAPAEGQLRAHAIAAVTPAQDPAHFIECVLDLFHHYQRSPDAKSPLVINTPGWIQGTGLDILTELITSLRPTEVIYTSQDGPEETVSSLQSACRGTTPPTPFSTLPSQPTEPSSSRTSLHFRTMQTMSYFHLQQPKQQQEYPTWDPTPLTDLRPWRVRYANKDRGFLGILCYDHQPAPELLAEAINGTVLAMVKLEDRKAALRGLRAPPFRPPSQADVDTAMDTDIDDPLTVSNTNPTPTSSYTTPAHQKEQQHPYKHKQHHHHHQNNTETLPLIQNPQGLTLSPAHSHLLGLVLVRGIDPVHNELQLLTPISHKAVEELNGQELVLVAGRFDTPSWAYSETLYRGRRGGITGGGASTAAAAAAASGADGQGGDEELDLGGEFDEDEGGNGDVEEDAEETEGEEQPQGRRTEVPWVEMLHGSQKRAAGSKVWRVRRDLGRG